MYCIQNHSFTCWFGCVRKVVCRKGKNIVMVILKKRVLRGVFESKGDEVTGSWGSHVLRSFVTCTLTKYSHVTQPNVGGRKVWALWHIWEREKCI